MKLLIKPTNKKLKYSLEVLQIWQKSVKEQELKLNSIDICTSGSFYSHKGINIEDGSFSLVHVSALG